MITYRDISIAVDSKLKAGFPDVEIQSSDVEEGFKRPSFFVRIDNADTKKFMANGRDRKLTVYINYFPSDPHGSEVELLDARDTLEDVFLIDGVLEIGDYRVFVDELKISASKSMNQKQTLLCKFDLEFNETYIEEVNPNLMEDLEVKEEVN